MKKSRPLKPPVVQTPSETLDLEQIPAQAAQKEPDAHPANDTHVQPHSPDMFP